MELVLQRVYKKPEYTIGKLSVEGKYFCDTLEDTERDLSKPENKVYGKTAIPCGYYVCRLIISPKFGECIEIVNVPLFSFIRMHAGNTAEDTSGCPLLGENKAVGRLINSRYWVNKLVAAMKNAEAHGDKIHHILVK